MRPRDWGKFEPKSRVIRHVPMSHNAPYLPPNFFWDSCNTQEKWKTKGLQNLGGGGGKKRKRGFRKGGGGGGDK